MNRSFNFFRCLSAMLFIFSLSATHATAGSGFLALQFAWDNSAYNPKYKVGVNITKGSIVKKNIQESTTRNNILLLKLSDGEYNLESLDFSGEDLLYEKFKMDFNRPFTIEDGKVTNGGLIFIGKGEQAGKRSHQVYFLTFDNQDDLGWYIQNQYVPFSNVPETYAQPAWVFSKNEGRDNMIHIYEKAMVDAETKNPRKGVNYLYGPFGLLIKLEKEANGQVVGSKKLNTATLRQIQAVQFYQGKMIVDLGQGHMLYGTDQDLEPVIYPDEVGENPQFKLIGLDKFMIVDDLINIFVSEGAGFNWKKQDAFCRKLDATNRPIVGFGQDHLFIYTYLVGNDWALLQAPYDNPHFENLKIDEEIKRIPLLQETASKLVIGPQTTNLVKRGSFVHAMDRSTNEWTTVQTPRGDCNTLYIDKAQDDNFKTYCGRYEYISQDAGANWVLLK